MKVQNMTSSRGNKIANQFIVNDARIEAGNDWYEGDVFQSYNSTIAVKANYWHDGLGKIRPEPALPRVVLDETYWDYSVTTSKYRNQFLGETKKETQAKIDSGEYILADLNA